MDIEALANKYGGDGPVPTTGTTDAVDALASKYGGNKIDTEVKLPPETYKGFADVVNNFGEGVKKGASDVLNTVGTGIGYIDKTIGGKEGVKRSEDFSKRVTEENKNFDQNYGDSNVADFGRVAGQIAMTAPLVPFKVIQGANAAFGALPTVLSTGEKVAAPLINRFGASLATGAIGGAEFGGLTSASNDKSLGENVAVGALGGAVGAPAANAAVGLGKLTAKAIASGWNNVLVSSALKNSGIAPNVATNIIERLSDAGFTPATAKIAIQKLGPGATLADLDRALITEASGLAARGGKETSILKGTFDARAATADDEASKIISTKLGAKPDLEAEKEAIVRSAQKEAGPDYKTAYASGHVLDAKPIVDEIDNSLTKAVGKEASELKTAKGYFFNQDKDGNAVLKTDVESLHKIRKALDQRLGELPVEGTSHASETYRAISTLRDKVDTLLKTNSEMKAADEKFAVKIAPKEGLQVGFDALKRSSGAFNDFEKEYTAATPEVKQAIAKGIHTHIADAMELATRGELSEAQKLFDKNSKNQKIIKLVFGHTGDEIIDAIKKQISFRGVERAVSGGSQTAERLAVTQRYGEGGNGQGFVKDALKAAALDITTGSPAIASGMNAARAIGSGARLHFNSARMDNLAEGTADLLSRQTLGSDKTLDVLGTVNKIYKRRVPKYRGEVSNKLPTVGAPLAITVYGDYNKLTQQTK